MSRFLATALGAILSLTGGPVTAADYLYVTDTLQLGLYEGEKATGARIKTLISGARVEVLSSAALYTRVRSADGDVGWVKSAFLVKEPPAVLKIDVLEEENSNLRKQVAALPVEPTDNLADLEEENRMLRDSIAQLETELKQSRLERITSDRPTPHPGPAIRFLASAVEFPVVVGGGLLIGGLLMGIGYAFGRRSAQNRMRSRLSGYRLG